MASEGQQLRFDGYTADISPVESPGGRHVDSPEMQAHLRRLREGVKAQGYYATVGQVEVIEIDEPVADVPELPKTSRTP